MQYRGMRGQTRPDAGQGVGYGPVHQLGEAGPVGLISQVGSKGLSAGDDQGIGGLPEKIREWRVAVGDERLSGGAARYFRQSRKPQLHRRPQRGLQQTTKL